MAVEKLTSGSGNEARGVADCLCLSLGDETIFGLIHYHTSLAAALRLQAPVAERPIVLPPASQEGSQTMLPSRWEMNIVAAAKELERMHRVVNEARSELHQIRMAAKETAVTSWALMARADRLLARQ